MGKICPICDKESDSLIEYQYGEETKEHCSVCKNAGMKKRMVICPRCGEKANYLQEYQEDGETKEHCSVCKQAEYSNQIKWINRKKFFKRHWRFWIMLGMAAIGLLIARDLI